jgi:hypothetical protein
MPQCENYSVKVPLKAQRRHVFEKLIHHRDLYTNFYKHKAKQLILLRRKVKEMEIHAHH